MAWKTTARRIALYALVFVLYLASTIPVGLGLYSIKNRLGVQIFKEGGLHDLVRCVNASFD
jgi:hypothetical protein